MTRIVVNESLKFLKKSKEVDLIQYTWDLPETEDMEEEEGNSIIDPVSETQVSIKVRDRIEKFVQENNEKFKDVIEKKKKKKKEIRELTQHIDPYDEEEWEDEFSYESFKIKKFNEI
jgi:DNA-directed RNA polymerase specialized sigma24 family protein